MCVCVLNSSCVCYIDVIYYICVTYILYAYIYMFFEINVS